MFPVHTLIRIYLLQGLSVLQGHTSVWIDEESHKRGEQDIDYQNRVYYYEAERPIDAVVPHILEIQKAHVQEKDGQEGIWEIFEFNHVGTPNVYRNDCHANHHYTYEEYEGDH